MSDINPTEFGELRATVRQLAADMSDVKQDLRALVSAKDQARGAAWLGRVAIGGAGGVVAWLAHKLWGGG